MDIFEAIKDNDIDKVKELLDSGIDVNSKDKHGDTLLIIAYKNNRIEIFKLLLSYPHIDINLRNEDNAAILHLACKYNNIEVVKLLLIRPEIKINIRNEHDDIPLHLACRHNYIEIVKLLLNHPNIDPNIRNGANDETSLFIASSRNNIEVVELLLSHPNINPNIINYSGQAPLYYVSSSNYIEIAKLLLKHPKIDVNKKNHLSETPLYTACRNNNIEIVKLLLTRPELDVNATDSENDTPIISSAFKGSYESLKLLLTHPDIDIFIKNRKALTVLHILCQNSPTPENLEVIKIILEKDDFLINSESNEGSPLYIAYEFSKKNKNTAIIELLLNDKNIDVNQIISYHGMSLLSLCCYDDNRINVAKLLLKHPNIDVKIKNNGETPLHICAEEGSIEMMKLLLSRSDIDINIKNDEEETPLKVACYGLNSEYSKIAKLLLSYPNIEIDFDYRNYTHDNIPLRQLFKNHKNNKLYKLTDVLSNIEN